MKAPRKSKKKSKTAKPLHPSVVKLRESAHKIRESLRNMPRATLEEAKAQGKLTQFHPSDAYL